MHCFNGRHFPLWITGDGAEGSETVARILSEGSRHDDIFTLPSVETGIVSEGNDLWIFEEMGIKTNVQQYTTTFAAGDGECDPRQPAFHVTKEVWKEKKERQHAASGRRVKKIHFLSLPEGATPA